MPIREYCCEQCGTQDERLELSSAVSYLNEPPICKGCGQAMKGIISGSFFRCYQPGGWYAPNKK